MVERKDVRSAEMGEWDMFTHVSVEEALPKIFAYAKSESASSREWYWSSIKVKRRASLVIRSFSLILVICGAILPILSSIFPEPQTRLYLTQCGVAALAFAGLLQACDKIFGWSSGWLRYVTTVMAMEDVTRKFEFDWAQYMLNKNGKLTDVDKLVLLELAKHFTNQIYVLQSDETNKWVAEFDRSLALLNNLIKSHEHASKGKNTASGSKSHSPATSTQTLGAVELSLIHKAEPISVSINIDDDDPEDFVGTHWSKLNVKPGMHCLALSIDKPKQNIQKIIDVSPGGVTYVNINLT